MRIALLEDERVLRESLAEVLVQHGHAVTACCAGVSELMNELRREPSDVALIDLRLTTDLGDQSGWQALTQVKQLYPGTRLVVLSGSGRVEDDVERARRSGANAYLSKSTVSVKDIIETIDRVRDGDSVFPLVGTAFSAPRQDPPSVASRFNLTQRETEVLRCLGEGMDNANVAVQLLITERTVRAHVSSLYKKLAAENRTQLALMAHDLGVRR